MSNIPFGYSNNNPFVGAGTAEVQSAFGGQVNNGQYASGYTYQNQQQQYYQQPQPQQYYPQQQPITATPADVNFNTAYGFITTAIDQLFKIRRITPDEANSLVGMSRQDAEFRNELYNFVYRQHGDYQVDPNTLYTSAYQFCELMTDEYRRRAARVNRPAEYYQSSSPQPQMNYNNNTYVQSHSGHPGDLTDIARMTASKFINRQNVETPVQNQPQTLRTPDIIPGTEYRGNQNTTTNTSAGTNQTGGYNVVEIPVRQERIVEVPKKEYSGELMYLPDPEEDDCWYDEPIVKQPAEDNAIKLKIQAYKERLKNSRSEEPEISVMTTIHGSDENSIDVINYCSKDIKTTDKSSPSSIIEEWSTMIDEDIPLYDEDVAVMVEYDELEILELPYSQGKLYMDNLVSEYNSRKNTSLSARIDSLSSAFKRIPSNIADYFRNTIVYNFNEAASVNMTRTSKNGNIETITISSFEEIKELISDDGSVPDWKQYGDGYKDAIVKCIQHAFSMMFSAKIKHYLDLDNIDHMKVMVSEPTLDMYIERKLDDGSMVHQNAKAVLQVGLTPATTALIKDQCATKFPILHKRKICLHSLKLGDKGYALDASDKQAYVPNGKLSATKYLKTIVGKYNCIKYINVDDTSQYHTPLLIGKGVRDQLTTRRARSF